MKSLVQLFKDLFLDLSDRVGRLPMKAKSDFMSTAPTKGVRQIPCTFVCLSAVFLPDPEESMAKRLKTQKDIKVAEHSLRALNRF